MAAKTQRANDGDGNFREMFFCPGCQEAHGPVVEGPGTRWTWNGSQERPTFFPSILVQSYRMVTDEEADAILRGEKVEPDPTIPTICHSFVTDGKIQFLGDCTHALAGKTVELPDWDEEQ